MSFCICLLCQQYYWVYKEGLEVHKRKIYLHFRNFSDHSSDNNNMRWTSLWNGVGAEKLEPFVETECPSWHTRATWMEQTKRA